MRAFRAASVNGERIVCMVLFGDFINGVVEREQDVLAERHPGRGFRMLFEKIEVSSGVELNTLSLGRVLRVRINPLLAILEKRAAVHEL